MTRHISWNILESKDLVDSVFLRCVEGLVEASRVNGVPQVSFTTWAPENRIYITLDWFSKYRNMDVLIACFFRDMHNLALCAPEYELRVHQRDLSDYGCWFATTADAIYYNEARREQFFLREIPEAIGCTGHVGITKVDTIKSMHVFGEANQARKVLKVIKKHATAKGHWLNVRPGEEIMAGCGTDVIVLIQATNGQFQVINDLAGFDSTAEQIRYAESSHYKNVNYSFLYNHPVFQK